ncbi:uncharacterized protein LOC131657831 [Vicia villosa]|uniref:uncharacterized protein LOC131657831 n=1 Tax=Vicia villosa TaxID=3911 RepID=UPI00273ACB8B|nr:uncharacterized protein LOC131657831 [Vicia villosa]
MQKVKEFSSTTGLVMSVPKSKIYMGGVDSECQNILMLETGFQIGQMPFRYLGVPLDSKRLTINNCQPLIDRMTCRIKHWCTRMLSYAGRFLLMKSVLFSIANYWLQISPLPKKIIHHIESLCRSFLWTGKDSISNKAPISWEHVCDPVAAGGLSLIDLTIWNRASLGKMLWNLNAKKDRMWISWVSHYYMKRGADATNYCAKQSDSWIIKSIFKYRDLFMSSRAWNEFLQTGTYRTKQIYLELRGDRGLVSWRNIFRGNMASPKALFILWMACQNRLHTKDRLNKIGIMTDGVCLYCNETETCVHLFFACRETRVFWLQVLNWSHIPHSPQAWTEELRWVTTAARGKSNRAELLRICVAEVIYHVWIVRNNRVFKNDRMAHLNLQWMLERIKYRANLDKKLRDYVDAL